MTATVHENLSFDAYCKLPGESATRLKQIHISPLNCLWWSEHDRPDMDALRVGRATHTAIYEPHKFLDEYVVWDGDRRAGNVWKAFELEHRSRGKTILTQNQHETAIQIAKAVRGHRLAGALLDEIGRAEISITWLHQRTGLPCKARLDWLCSALIDLKTTKNIEPRLFAGDFARYGYDLQLAHYRAALYALGIEVPVKVIAAQNVAPFDVALYNVPDEVILIGEQKAEAALDKLAACRASGSWPGLAAEEEITLHLPAWAMPDYEDGDEEVTISQGAA